MDQEREQERLTYRLCRLGFAVLSIALVVACATTLLDLPRQFAGRAVIPWVQGSDWWKWLDAPVVWGCLVGWYLLWGRWTHPGWQRRAGLLVVMGMIDIVLWLIKHGEPLGLRTGDFGHAWVRENLGEALGWAEFALTAGLACDVMVHLGVEPAAETGQATRSLAATGAAVWMLLFCLLTDWSRWPLGHRQFVGFNPLLILLHMGSTMVWTITLIQVTALTVAASRQCGRALAEMDREDAENDPLRPASDRDAYSFPNFERSRGE
jgi:hypothetical protein